MMSGMRKVRKLLKMLLKVAKMRTTHSGKNCPKVIPSTMAMMMRGNRGILIFFIVKLCFKGFKIKVLLR